MRHAIAKYAHMLDRWTRRNPAVSFTAAAFTAYGTVLFLPSNYRWFTLQRMAIAAGQVGVGIIEFPLRILSLFFAPQFWSLFSAVAIPFLALSGFVVGKIVQALWTAHVGLKLLVVAAVIGNIFIGLFVMFWSDTLVAEETSQECEHYLSAAEGLRVVVFSEVGPLPGTHFFYLFTRDGGKTWEQVTTIREADRVQPTCYSVKSLDESFIWVWSNWSVSTTQNGGATWNTWEWECCAYGAVQEVEFENTQNGRMKVYPSRTAVAELYTTDGGKTWSIAK